MVKIDINDEEIQALDLIMREARVPINIGAILAMFRNKIAIAFNKEQKKELEKKKKGKKA